MAPRNTSGTKAVPRLVVKIIGSKQVKYFITEETDKVNKAAIPPAVVDNVMKEPPDKQDSIVTRSHRQAEAEGGVGSAFQAELHKASNRLCMTAPSGDRSLSYIHQKNPAVIRTELRVGTAARASEEEKTRTKPDV
ncbi:uncharacterized protein LOC135511762 [Oncorhynchus masou masou]|uniref:uncharacterized protein LOC135511762 n=1 Tax=Oncorhynchus masou masou TaxID=90313 RepID=UPI0031837E03